MGLPYKGDHEEAPPIIQPPKASESVKHTACLEQHRGKINV